MMIVWDCKPGARRALEAHIKKWSFLVPSWCHTLHLDFSTEGTEEGVIMSTNHMPEYRKAYIYAHPIFLTYDAEEQERSVVHELLHLQIAPLTEFSSTLLTKLTDPSSTLGDWAREEHRRALEGVVEDLRLVVARVVEKG